MHRTLYVLCGVLKSAKIKSLEPVHRDVGESAREPTQARTERNRQPSVLRSHDCCPVSGVFVEPLALRRCPSARVLSVVIWRYPYPFCLFPSVVLFFICFVCDVIIFSAPVRLTCHYLPTLKPPTSFMMRYTRFYGLVICHHETCVLAYNSKHGKNGT